MQHLDHWSKNTVEFLTQHLAEAVRTIRIATGFFTVQGYDLVRTALFGKRVMILVGFDETAAERLKAKMVEDIMAHLARWDAENRRDAVLDLVRTIQAGELRIVERESIALVDARIRQGDHAKLYILDETAVFVGSSNLTASGLRHNVEAIAGHDAPERVHQWLDWFQHYWDAKDTYDLTQALLEALLRWLTLAAPHDIYLKTILALVPEDEMIVPRDSYKTPVEYQRVVSARMLRQLQDWRGAFLVASTGLGKTVIATHTAYCLRCMNAILNVIVFAPRAILPDWDDTLARTGLGYKLFTRDLLDKTVRGQGAGRRMVEELERVDERYLIIIDESQWFRNRLTATGDGERLSFQKLRAIIKRKRPKVILLTATPFAKGIDDLNNQLYLLPHTAPQTNVDAQGQMVMDIFADDVLEQRVWKVPETDDFFEAFMRLPVCTVISTSQVARNFATRTEQGEYVLFGEERKWLPQIEIHKTSVPVLAEEAMSHALAQGYFKHQLKSFKSRFGFQRTEATIEQQAMIAWMSSPLALDEVLTKTVQDVYDVEFIRSQPERQHMLQPIIDELQQLAYQDDAKLLALVHHLDTCLQQQQKVLIFTERLATAVYLERRLQHFLPDAHIANVVHETETGTYELKEFEKEVAPLICDFAPIANSDKTAVYATGKSYNVLISTDAFAAGVNLQDASVVISYDLAWTPEVIIQRAGRILRFWREPRQVALFVFVGTFVVDVEHQQTARRVEARLRRLVQRTRHAEKFSELPMIPEGESATYATLSNLASVTTEHIGRVDITQIEEFSGVSPFLMHITALSQHRDYAQQIPDDLTSAIYYDGSHHLIYLLLRYEGTFEWMLYDVQAKRLLPVKEDQLLDLIQCSEDTEPAPVDPVVVEKYAQMARKRWIEKKAIDTPDAVERICALYLIPETADIAAMFREVLTP